ncbi:MAG: CpaF family protein [Pseudomonadota bacterium]
MDHKLKIKLISKFINKLNHDGFSDEYLESKAKNDFIKFIKEEFPEVDIDSNQNDIKRIFKDITSWGPISKFLNDENVTEIMINGPDIIYVEKAGKLQKTDAKFLCTETLDFLIERILLPLGKRVNEDVAFADARLKDGSRVNIIIPPLAVKGPNVTIRKFSSLPTNEDFFLESKTLSMEAIEFLKICVAQKQNIVISGGTGSGKTTLLNFLSSFIPDDDRIVTVEDTAELKLAQSHVVPLEGRAANPHGKSEVSIRDLVINSLRMRPDRIVVGECRGKEAIDMLQAMNTGHDGSLTTIHANSIRDTFSRIETMVLTAGIDIPILSIRKQIASAINVLIQISRMADGSRRVTRISEITGMENEVVLTSDIFNLEKDKKGKQSLISTGLVPVFYDNMRRKGIDLNLAIFEN